MKPREWWFHEDYNFSKESALQANIDSGYGPHKYKTRCYVEKSAYDQMEKERDETRADYQAALDSIAVYKKIIARDGYTAALEAINERDRYALAMAHALRVGLFPNKAAVKEEIEQILATSAESGEMK